MFNKHLVMFSAILFFGFFAANAQDRDTVIVDKEGEKDTIIIENDDNDWDHNWDDDQDWDSSDSDEDWNDNSENNSSRRDFGWRFDAMEFHGKPTIAAYYGLSKLKRQELNTNFAHQGLLELQLGYSTQKNEFAESILTYSFQFFRVSDITNNLAKKSMDTPRGPADTLRDLNFDSRAWKFGFGREKGYGWMFGESGIIPYHSYGFEWTRLEMNGYMPVRTPSGVRLGLYNDTEFQPGNDEATTLNSYNKTFRFGTSFIGGIKFRLIGGISIDAAYERSIIFEKHLFWKWAGSTVLEIGAQGLLDTFIEKIGDSSPYALPLINFVLKNALSYGIYELRQEKMNWPFKSAPPLSYDQFKVGLSFVF